MAENPAAIVGSYSAGSLMGRIRSALAKAGVDPTSFKAEDLKPLDEFHVGGVQAIEELLDQLDIDISATTHILDMGSGIGGTARFLASRYGARVTAIDLNPDFVKTAHELTNAVGLTDLVTFQTGSVLNTPVETGSCDLVLLIHVGMNIEDKLALFREARRVLRSGGIFAVFDMMKMNAEPLTFPLPWARSSENSFLDSPGRYRAAAAACGFTIVSERSRRDFALEFFTRIIQKAEEAGGAPPLTVNLLMESAGRTRMENIMKDVRTGSVEPFEMIFRASYDSSS